jgi:hypothetical protein
MREHECILPTPTVSSKAIDGILTTQPPNSLPGRHQAPPNRFSIAGMIRPAFLQGQGDRARKVGANNALLILRSM